MKQIRLFFYSILILMVVYPWSPVVARDTAYSGYPTISIYAVIKDQSVTIKGSNFPANDHFTVTMGSYGTHGIGGIVIGTTSTGTGGSFTKTYDIPKTLSGLYRIAIRIQSPTSGYYAYNWFYNNTAGSSTTPGSGGYVGYPTFIITEVVRDNSVTIKGYNFPADDQFKVTMGAYGTNGIGGIVVETTNSGSGGTFVKTYSIPSSLAGSYRIAIRLQSPTSGYFAYNWFYNNSTGTVGSGGTVPTGYTGYPTFKIAAVVRDKSVTINGSNFPANDKFVVTIGAYGTLGMGGVVVDTTDSGNGGSFTKTYTIPGALAGSNRLAIRLQSPTSGYYAYNWFYNNSTP